MKPIIILISLCVVLLSSLVKNVGSSCFSSIIGFGDLLIDTGNSLSTYPRDSPSHVGKPPYGITYFHKPTGRYSDGRLVIDFIAEYLGLPYVEPYFLSQDYHKGVNFAIAGATAINTEFFLDSYDPESKGSLGVQMNLCKKMLASLPPKPSHELLSNALIVMGEIGGNDYNHFLVDGGNVQLAQTFIRPVIDKIGSAITELIELGAVSFFVPGNLPVGCITFFLTAFDSKLTKKDYDPKTGCINWINDFTQKHNRMLQIELNRIQLLYPHTTITYGDYYNAVMPIYRAPKEYGFVNTFVACCGGGGKYNYNATWKCGDSTLGICDDPSTFVNWDGYHLSKAANKILSKHLFEGPDSDTLFKHLCVSKSSS